MGPGSSGHRKSATKDYSDLNSIDQKEGLIDLSVAGCGAWRLPRGRDGRNWFEEINLKGNKAPLHLIKAGKRDDQIYFKGSGISDVRLFYEDQNGGYQLEELLEQWTQWYDFVLIDSRTGVTDSGGICTVQLPDILLLLFSATEQSLSGIVDIANNVSLARQELPFDCPKLPIVPIASRFDIDKEFDLSNKWLDDSAERLSSLYADWLPKEVAARDILQVTKIPYKAYFSFGEKLAVMEESVVEKSSLSYAYKIIAALISYKFEGTAALLENQDSYIDQALNKGRHIFISHSSKDDNFVRDLRVNLEALGLSAWLDSRSTSEDSGLSSQVARAIEQARQVIVVISPHTPNSPRLRSEVSKALEVEKRRKDSGYRVIPLLLPGAEPVALSLWFGEEPVGVRVEVRPGGLSEALPQILEALGERLPDDRKPIQELAARTVAELKLRLKDARFEEISEGKWRVKALAQLIYDPADTPGPALTARSSGSLRRSVRLRRRPTLVFGGGDYSGERRFHRTRETHCGELPQWGRALYDAATAAIGADLLADWQQAADGVERRFSIYVDGRPPEGSSDDEQSAASEAPQRVARAAVGVDARRA